MQRTHSDGAKGYMRVAMLLPLVLVSAALILAACVAPPTATSAEPTAAPANDNQPRVFFSNIADGDSVTSPYTVTMTAENFGIAPAGEIKPGEGHLHIMVDVPCVADGEVIVKDDAHLHYGQGQLQAGLTLTPGAHTLCLQAADGAHTALAGEGMRQQIAITVQ